MKKLTENNFQQVYNYNIRKVFNICLNIVQNREDAEDIVQEVFVEVHHSLHNFDERSLVSTWIYRIAVNKSLDFVRAKKRKKRSAFFTQLFHPDTGEQLHEAAHFDHPGVALENKERTMILFGAINQLPENQRLAFILHKIEGFPQKEIAAIMQLTDKAVESLVGRAKENLRKILGNIYNERGI